MSILLEDEVLSNESDGTPMSFSYCRSIAFLLVDLASISSSYCIMINF